MIYVFYYFFQKSLFTENYFLIAGIDLATRGPLYTCLVYQKILLCAHNYSKEIDLSTTDYYVRKEQ